MGKQFSYTVILEKVKFINGQFITVFDNKIQPKTK